MINGALCTARILEGFKKLLFRPAIRPSSFNVLANPSHILSHMVCSIDWTHWTYPIFYFSINIHHFWSSWRTSSVLYSSKYGFQIYFRRYSLHPRHPPLLIHHGFLSSIMQRIREAYSHLFSPSSTTIHSKTSGCSSPTTHYQKCPIEALMLNVCVNVLNGLVNAIIGNEGSSKPYCSLIKGLVDLDAAICLCTSTIACGRFILLQVSSTLNYFSS